MHLLSARELREKFVRGELSAVEITRYFLDRIEAVDGQLGAFLRTYNERALAQAKALDKKRADGKPLGMLAGVPIGIKDNIHVKGELTTCASKFLANFRTPFDATVTQLIEAEDGIILGKTNLDEFAMGSSTEFSALGDTRNPWDLNRVPGGSSGGSAAAVAARLVPLALGSDTGGSIRQPAALTGIVGFKPTYGRVSRFGMVAFGSSLDQIGPFSTSVADAALMTEVIAKHCVRDSTSLPSPEGSYGESLGKDIAGLKVGVPYSFLKDLAEEPRRNFDAAIETLQEQGCEIVDVDLDIIKHAIAVYYVVSNAEASTNLARFDGVRYGVRSSEAKSLDEVYELSKHDGFGDEVKRRILTGTFVLSAGYQDAYYKKAQKVRTLIIDKYREAFQCCDIIAMPVSPFTAWKRKEIQESLELYLADLYTISANMVGSPAISVPSGFSEDGLPYGLQLTGPQQQEGLVFQVADAYERATEHSKALPSLAK